MAEDSRQVEANDERQICRREDFTGSLVKMTCKEKRLLKRPPRVFSEQFQVYVEREMERCVGASDEERFQIHREVFQYLIEQFAEHRSILCDVKVQYDAAIKRRDENIRAFRDRNRQLTAETERHARKLKAAQVCAYRDVEELQMAQARMRHRMALLSEERQKLARELEEVREALLVEQSRYREEHDAHQVAQNDLSDLTQRYDNLLRRLNSRPPPTDTKSSSAADDPIVLRVALTKCREELSAVSARLVVMETSYTEVVPLRDLKLALAETERVRAQGEERLAALQQVLQQERETEVFRTPRPDWNRASTYVPGGETTWLPLRDSLPSSDIMLVLLDQLSAPGPDVFTGLGTEAEIIPALLKWQGDVRNLRITRRQVVHIICDIFECKVQNEEPFQDFVTMYFKERYPFSWAEWTYSFHFALERLTSDDAHHLLVGLDAPAAGGEAAESPPEGPGVAPPPPEGSSRGPPPPAGGPGVAPPPPEGSSRGPPPPAGGPGQTGSGRSHPTSEGSSRAPSAPEKLNQLHHLLEQQQHRQSAESAPSESSAVARSASLVPEEEEEESQAATAPAPQPPAPEVQNRRIQLFWNVLYGVQHEAVYMRDRYAIQQLKKEFSVADADKKGKVLYDSLGRIISETYFTSKTDEEIQRLVLAAAFGRPELDPGHVPPVDTVDYSRFLDTCREMDSAFLQEFYQQMDRVGGVYIDQLTELLNDGDVIQRSTLSQAVISLTPDVAATDLQRMCHWICPEEGQGVPLEQCVQRLKGLPVPPERTAPGEADAA